MRVTRVQIETFILKIARTRDREASCDDCARLSAQLVEALQSGDVTDEELLDILHHLKQCIPCAQEFKVLEECARMDAEESWPSFEEMWRQIDSDR